MKPTRFRLRRAAYRDLIAIGRYTRERWGDQCDRYLAQLDARFQAIARNPAASIDCDQIRPGYRSCREGRHVIFFKLSRNTVEIVRILHDRMLPRLHLQG